VTAENLEPGVIDDNRVNRNMPAEISVLFIGYEDGDRMIHRLPPHPPLSLDAMFPCSEQEVMAFTSAGRLAISAIFCVLWIYQSLRSLPPILRRQLKFMPDMMIPAG